MLPSKNLAIQREVSEKSIRGSSVRERSLKMSGELNAHRGGLVSVRRGFGKPKGSTSGPLGLQFCPDIGSQSHEPVRINHMEGTSFN